MFFSTPGSGEQHNFGKFFGGHHEDPFRQPDLHPMNIIDLDICPHPMKHTFLIPNFEKKNIRSVILTPQERILHSEKSLTSLLASTNYLLMPEQQAQTDWHQDFTGTCVFYFLLKGRKEFYIVELTQKARQCFDEWRKIAWKKFEKGKISYFISVYIENCDLFPYC